MADSSGPLTREAFVNELRRVEPDLAPLLDEHFADFDELLIHILMPDLLREATRRFAAGNTSSSRHLLDLVADAFVRGDDALKAAVVVSFVDGVGAWPGETDEFIASWPRPLTKELERQRRAQLRS